MDMSRGDNVQRILGAIDPFWGKTGAETNPAEPEFFFCVVIETTFRQLRNTRFSPNLTTKRNSVSRHGIQKDIFKTFHLGVICPQNLKPKVGHTLQAPHSEQATGHGMHCREILFAPRCSPRAREFPRLVNFTARRTVAELRGVKVAQFSDFGLFSPYKTPKTYVPVTSLQPRGLHRRMITIFPCGSRRSKVVPSGSRVFLRLLVGELGTPSR